MTQMSTLFFSLQSYAIKGLSRRLSGKKSACRAGDTGFILELGRSPGEGNGNPLQYSCLGNPMDRGDWRAMVHGVIRIGHDLATKPPPPCNKNSVLQKRGGLLYLQSYFGGKQIARLLSIEMRRRSRFYAVQNVCNFGVPL